MDLLGELGAFMYRPRLLLSSPLGRVEALAVPFPMLLDVLVLGHLLWGRGGGVGRVAATAALSGVARRPQRGLLISVGAARIQWLW